MRLAHHICAFSVAMSALVNVTVGAESIAAGKVKSVDQAKHEFVLTESTGKDRTIKLSENVVINRAGLDGQTELKAKDTICAFCDKNAVIWTATYILVQEGESKNWTLGHGDVTAYDPEKKEITYTDDQGRPWTYSTIDVKVYINKVESKPESIKIGEHLLALLQKAGDRTTLKNIYITRK